MFYFLSPEYFPVRISFPKLDLFTIGVVSESAYTQQLPMAFFSVGDVCEYF